MSTFIICAILLTIVGFIIRNWIHNHKHHDCANGCGHCKGCH